MTTTEPRIVDAGEVLNRKILVHFASQCFFNGPSPQTLFASRTVVEALACYAGKSELQMAPRGLHEFLVETPIGTWHVQVREGVESSGEVAAISLNPKTSEVVAELRNVRDYQTEADDFRMTLKEAGR